MCYYSKKDILDRGWSAGMIETFLSEPYIIVNMADRRRRTRVWVSEDVMAAEKMPEFSARKKKYELWCWQREYKDIPHKEIAHDIVDYINSIVIKRYDEATLIRKTISSTPPSGKIKSIDDYMVNFLRHNTSGYNQIIHDYTHDDRLVPYYYIVKICLMRKIAAQYPYLSRACDRQIKGAYQSFYDKKTRISKMNLDRIMEMMGDLIL